MFSGSKNTSQRKEETDNVLTNKTEQVTSGMKQRARFTKQGKLALERNSIKAQMGGENSAGDLLTTRTLKNTDAARAFP